MSVTHTGQRVGMFDLHYLGVELGVLSFLKSAFHFAFLGVFTSRHLAASLQGMRSGLLLFPLRVALTLLTLCLLKVAQNLKDANAGVSLVQHVQLLVSGATFSNLPTPDLFVNCFDVLQSLIQLILRVLHFECFSHGTRIHQLWEPGMSVEKKIVRTVLCRALIFKFSKHMNISLILQQ